jgi:hypothetical protein
MAEKYVNFFRSHLYRMAFVVEENVALDPVQICFYCLKCIPFIAKILLYLVKEALRPLRGRGGNIIHEAYLALKLYIDTVVPCVDIASRFSGDPV